MRGKIAYFVKVENYVNNPVLNILIHTVFQIIRGLAGIIDGLVLILSLGCWFPALGFRMVIFIHKRVKQEDQ
jgi:hypothetical protein